MIEIEAYTGKITAGLMELLLQADPDKHAILKYLPQSTLYVALELETIIGVAVLVNADNRYELKNIAVHESYRGQSIAKRLISTVKEAVKNVGGDELFVGTGNSSLSQLALYQKCGFRMQHIKKDFFLDYPEKIVENGIQCIDMVILNIKFDT